MFCSIVAIKEQGEKKHIYYLKLIKLCETIECKLDITKFNKESKRQKKTVHKSGNVK